ncbi:hypothetical protein N8368_02785 [Bacteroidia bacterium]|nr:hypothetical protein [Bacteroidia bacterium]MDB9882867.1 hypothetical protein [Bacteroidia bacterium]MDC1395413.1 hypothetical protein [Bacteroidia bacterium]
MNKSILTFGLILSSLLSFAQLPKLAVVSFDANDQSLNGQELLEILRLEISKEAKYSTIDKYEVSENLKNNGIDATTCFSQSCLKSAGKLLGADYLLTGSANKLGDRIFISLRMVDMKTNEQVETSKEFNYIPKKASLMVKMTADKMLGRPSDIDLEKSLSDKESFESATNNPDDYYLNLSGPRMGYTFFTGEGADIIRAKKSVGGYDRNPAFFQMGYQFEKQYLNQGNVQALFEFVPMITGLDQGLFIPSLTIFNGIRNNKNGLEFAVGPSVNISKESEQGYYEPTDKYYTYQEFLEFRQASTTLITEDFYDLEKEYKSDSRGSYRLKSYIVLAAGYSFKSGKLNIPVNAYVVPSKDNLRFGVSVGFNTRN